MDLENRKREVEIPSYSNYVNRHEESNAEIPKVCFFNIVELNLLALYKIACPFSLNGYKESKMISDVSDTSSERWRTSFLHDRSLKWAIAR